MVVVMEVMMVVMGFMVAAAFMAIDKVDMVMLMVMVEL